MLMRGNSIYGFSKKGCGVHYGTASGECAKCKYFNSEHYQQLQRDGHQHSGAPWILVMGERREDERGKIKSLHDGL